MNNLNFDGSSTYHISPELIINIRSYSIEYPSMCPEFDPTPEIYCTNNIIDVIDLESGEIRSINTADAELQPVHIPLKKLYDEISKHSFKNRAKFRMELWTIIRDITPYNELSKTLQKNRDISTDTYPQKNSKYFADIKVSELEKMIQDKIEEVGQNLNDWRMYNDIVPENYKGNASSYINKLKELITYKKALIFANN